MSKEGPEMGRHQTWDRRAWSISLAQDEPFTIETTGGATWALRALIAAGSEGLRPTDSSTGRFAFLIGQLRELGLEIDDLAPDEEAARIGFVLACLVEPKR
jgi:hypothetical protein